MAVDDSPAAGPNLSVCVLASGSKGNAVYVAGGSTAILVDAGLSGVKIERRMASRGLSPEHLNAIVVTHEHGDHIRGVGVLSRRYRLPVYINQTTLQHSARHLGNMSRVVHFDCGRGFSIGSLSIHPFSVSHDAGDPACFAIAQNGCKVGVVTDLGIAGALVRERLKGCQALVLEANHDPEMLKTGPYPWHLKQRIMSRHGHLSNDAAMELVAELYHDELEHVVLAHLSEENNTPEKAAAQVARAIANTRVQLSVAGQDEAGELICLGLSA